MKTETVNIGLFDVQSDKLVVTDPCYDLDENIIENPKKGLWHSSIEVSDQKSWGKRVAELFACHSSWKDESRYNWERCDFTVGVDSGQAGIFDLPVFENKQLKEPYLQVGNKEYSDRQWEFLIKQTEQLYKLNPQESKDRMMYVEELKKQLLRLPETTTDWYEMCCDKTLGKQRAGVIPGGGVSSSGFGDGGYTAFFAKDADEQVVAVKIVFIPEEEDEEFEDDDDRDED